MIKKIMGIFILLILACIVFIGTPLGLKSAIAITQHASHESVRITGAKGSLLHSVSFKNIHVRSNALTLNINNATLSWNPAYLLIAKLSINTLDIKSITAHLIKHKESPPSNSKKIIPLKLRLKKAHIESLIIHDDARKKTYAAHDINASANINTHTLTGTLNLETTAPIASKINARVTGSLSHYAFNASTRSKLYNAAITGSGDQNHITLALDSTHNTTGRVEGQAHWQWYPGQSGAVYLTLENIPINKHPISGNIDLSYKNWGHFKIDANLNSSIGRLSIKGSHNTSWDMQWRSNIHAFNRLFPSINIGRIKGAGHIRGTNSNPDISGKLNVSHLHWNGINLKTLQLSLNGTLKKQTLTTSVINTYGHANVTLQGGINRSLKNWRGRVADLSYYQNKQTRWQLNKPAQLTLSQDRARLNSLCLTNKKNGSLCIQGNWSRDEKWAAFINSKLSLALINASLPNHTQLQGRLDAKIQASGLGPTLGRASIKAALYQGAIHVNKKPDFLTIPINRATLTAHYKNKTLTLAQDAVLNTQNNIALNAKLSPLTIGNASHNPHMHITLNANMKTLAPINALLPHNAKLTGTLKSQLNIGGTLNDPTLNGTIALNKSQLDLTQIGLVLTDAMLSFNNQKNALNYKLTLKTNHQPLVLHGTTNLKDLSLNSVVTLTGNDLPIMNTVNYKVAITPDLKLKYNPPDLRITGSAIIPSANIMPQDFNSTAVIPRSDIVYVSDMNTTKKGLQFFSTVKITAGNDVRIDTHGVTGKLEGAITLVKEPEQPLSADGQLHVVDAHYQTHGHKLAITRGIINYTHSPVANPNLDITASRSFNTFSASGLSNLVNGKLIVGVRVTGSAAHPAINLFSIPATLSQSDILSYLILGHGSGSNSSSDTALLLQALNSFGGSGGIGGITEGLQKGLGLSELGVESETNVDAAGNPINSQNAFVVGKYLTPKLYLRYSMGLVDSVSTVTLRYFINHHWSIQTENSTDGNGGDILYSFSRE
jgi:autotransporter translocation and assembly factor TamB